jgi:hypothetical protein
VSWLEHSNASVYRRDVLRKLHRERFIEYDVLTAVRHSREGAAFALATQQGRQDSNCNPPVLRGRWTLVDVRR